MKVLVGAVIGPVIPLPTREEMLAATLPWEVHSDSIAPSGKRTPVVTRFGTEDKARRFATQPGATVRRVP